MITLLHLRCRNLCRSRVGSSEEQAGFSADTCHIATAVRRSNRRSGSGINSSSSLGTHRWALGTALGHRHIDSWVY